jgi:putative RecB family exonuclease
MRRGARPNIISHSRLSSFEDCPRKFEYRYLLRLPPEAESIESFMGKRVHEVLERLYSFAGRGQIPGLEKVLRRYRIFWEEHWDAERVRITRKEMSALSYQKNGERYLANFYRRHYPFDADETLGLEQRVTFSLDGSDSYRIQGVIDRVVRARDGAIEIHDYKTGQRVPRQKQLDGDRQLGLYQIGIAEAYGTDQPIRLVWHYLAAGRICTSSRTPAQLEELRAKTIGLIDRIRAATEFEARPGPLCPWCEFRDRCRRAMDAREAVPPRFATR